VFGISTQPSSLAILNIRSRAARLRNFRPAPGARTTLSLHHHQGNRQPRLISTVRHAPPGAGQRRQGAGVLDIGGSMDSHIEQARGSLSRRRKTEFKHMSIFPNFHTACSRRPHGNRTSGDLTTAPRPGMCCISIRTTTKVSSSARLDVPYEVRCLAGFGRACPPKEAGSVLASIASRAPNPHAGMASIRWPQKHWAYSKSTTHHPPGPVSNRMVPDHDRKGMERANEGSCAVAEYVALGRSAALSGAAAEPGHQMAVPCGSRALRCIVKTPAPPSGTR